MKETLAALTLLAALIGTGCASSPSQPSSMTPLEIQAMQAKEFETTKHVAFASVMSVFQDLGYIIEEADEGTGFITAKSPTSAKTDWILTGNTYHSETKATAFVEQLRPGVARIRLNFVLTKRTSSVWGQDRVKETPILDPQAYTVAFDKIGEAIFVRSGTQGD